MARELISALERNTRAVNDNTRVLHRLVEKEDKQKQLASRRKNLLSGCPYTMDQLYELKRQDLVMLASQLGLKNTSVSQSTLVRNVYDNQFLVRNTHK